MKLIELSIPFPESDIEWRIQSSGKRQSGDIWASCVPYIRARAIMERLDEVVGPENWQVSYNFIEGKDAVPAGVVSRIKILFDGRWVSKEDGAEFTDIEPFKGGISAALKRAGVAWGIGRYLYNMDMAWARIVPQGTTDASYGKLKDGTSFYWLPPILEKITPPQEKGDPTKSPVKPVSPVSKEEPEAKKEYIIPKTRTQLTLAIGSEINRLNLSTEALKEWVMEDYKKSAVEMTLDELSDLLEALMLEPGDVNERA